MSQSYHEQQAELLAAYEQARGPARLDVLFELLALGKQHDDGDFVAETAVALIRDGSAEHRIDVEIRAFGELRRLYDSHARFNYLASGICWYYKWIAEDLPGYLDVPADQIHRTLDEMERFYTEVGRGLRPVHQSRCRAAVVMKELDQARHWFDLWQQTESGDSDDCEACEVDGRVKTLLALGETLKALAAAEPVLTGKVSCEEVPTITMSRLLVPLAAHERAEEAYAYHRLTRRHVRHVPKLYGFLADHVIYLTAIGQLESALRCSMTMLMRRRSVGSEMDRFRSAAAAWILFRRLEQIGMKRIELPRRVDERYCEGATPASIADDFERETRQLATAFNRRNGNDGFDRVVTWCEGAAGDPQNGP